MRRILLAALLAFVPCAHPQATAPAAPNYADPATWVCRPGAENVCTAGLDAVVLDANGHRTPQPFTPAVNPPIDCFYIYPTVSEEQTDYADLTPSPEIKATVNAQAGRLTSRCRVYAPLYRQFTLKHLRDRMQGTSGPEATYPTDDVASAWNYYLEHDNHGRGVVIVGHSQGTILLQALIAKSIDGTPSQSLLVSAFLAGDPSLGVPPGKTVGGTFAHIPLCTVAAQTGCVYVWSSYLDIDDTPHRVFGHLRKDGLVSACANPAAPAGGPGALKVYRGKLPTDDIAGRVTVEALGVFTGTCTPDPEGSVLRISAPPGPQRDALLGGPMVRAIGRAGWGLHSRDVALEMGNILDVLAVETAAWTAAPHPAPPAKAQ